MYDVTIIVLITRLYVQTYACFGFFGWHNIINRLIQDLYFLINKNTASPRHETKKYVFEPVWDVC